MPIRINPPKLLISGSLDSINDKMMRNNRTFVFLGPQENFLNRTPSSWVEAFEMYITGLYKVYHEFGMEFLKCYCNEAISHNSNFSFIKHIQFIENCRGALQHSGELGNRIKAFNTIKNFVFSSQDTDFSFVDWNDFWENAEDRHWKKVTLSIIYNSNKLLDYLEKIALYDTDSENIGKTVFADFINRTFYAYRIVNGTVVKDRSIDIYESSLNARFFRIVRNQLKMDQAFKIQEQDQANAELKSLIQINPKSTNGSETDIRSLTEISAGVKTPQQIKAAIIDTIIDDLKNSGESILQASPFDYIVSVIEQHIKKQLYARMTAELMEPLAP